jgi:hypothetical protein
MRTAPASLAERPAPTSRVTPTKAQTHEDRKSADKAAPAKERSELAQLAPERRKAGRRTLEFLTGFVLGGGAFSAIVLTPCTAVPADECSDGAFRRVVAGGILTGPAFIGLGVWLGGLMVGPDRTVSPLGSDILWAYLGSIPGLAVAAVGGALQDEAARAGLFGVGGAGAVIGAIAASMKAHEDTLRERHRLRLAPTGGVTRDGARWIGLAGTF